MSKALRRHHEHRLKRAIAKRVGNTKYYRGSKEKMVGKLFHTPATCSCPMCGNPRKWNKEKTVQERRADQEYE